MKKRYIGIVCLVVAAIMAAFLSVRSMAVTPGARDCDANSIINCGALTQAELLSKFDANTTGDLPAVFAHYGISRSDMTGATSEVKLGTVYRDGRVEVDGKIVANNARSVGRQSNGQSQAVTINNRTYYERATSTIFRSDIAAFVLMRNGQFYAAVLTSCGNPVVATPVTPPPVPKPTPPTKPEAVPVYKCNSLSAQVISMTDRTYEYRLSYTATGGATLTSVDYNFGDNQTKTVPGTEAQVLTHTYQTPGSYRTVATLNFSVAENGQTTTKNVACEAVIATAPEMCPILPSVPKNDVRCQPCPVPGKEYLPKDSSECVAQIRPVPVTPAATVVPPELPKTGVSDFISGGLGIGSLTAAGYYWRASRRQLLERR